MLAKGEARIIFGRLRGILEKHAPRFSVTADTQDRYCLEAPPGPATVRAWRGELRRARIPVAWIEIGKTGVSYHLMGIYGSSARPVFSEGLRARMSGKTCFSFKRGDERLFAELEEVTARSLAAFRKEGFISAAVFERPEVR